MSVVHACNKLYVGYDTLALSVHAQHHGSVKQQTASRALPALNSASLLRINRTLQYIVNLTFMMTCPYLILFY